MDGQPPLCLPEDPVESARRSPGSSPRITIAAPVVLGEPVQGDIEEKAHQGRPGNEKADTVVSQDIDGTNPKMSFSWGPKRGISHL